MTFDQLSDDRLQELRQLHEAFLDKLEALAVRAIASNDWDDFYTHLIEFQSEHDLHGVTGIAIGEDIRTNGCDPSSSLVPAEFFTSLMLGASAEVLARPGTDHSQTTAVNEP